VAAPLFLEPFQYVGIDPSTFADHTVEASAERSEMTFNPRSTLIFVVLVFADI
jgi:hypothetical protein